jgi:hypothetical protein
LLGVFKEVYQMEWNAFCLLHVHILPIFCTTKFFRWKINFSIWQTLGIPGSRPFKDKYLISSLVSTFKDKYLISTLVSTYVSQDIRGKNHSTLSTLWREQRQFSQTWILAKRATIKQPTVLCKWWVTTADHSFQSVMYLYGSFFSWYVTPQIRNSSMMLLDGAISAIVTLPPNCLIYRYVSYDHRCWSAAVTHHSQSDLRLLFIIGWQSDYQIRNRHRMIF